MSTPPNDGSPQWGSPAEGHNDAAANPYPATPGGKYGTDAYNPNAYGGPVQEPAKYGKLKQFTLLSFGLYVLSAIISLVPMFTGEAEEVAREQLANQDLGGMSVDEVLSVSMAVAWAIILVPLVIAIGLYLLVYFGLKNNKNWARVLGIVMAIIGILLTAGTLLFNLGALATVFGLVTLVVTVAWLAVTVYWLVLAFNDENVQYLQQFNRSA
ncbi:hypothetical protein [Nesterenkonia alkaliphila]|uniref:Uncharacterized protein n=1 Tax=Nesterenkonia alkaliphila TaxID=1463631 RepID=A0A7K1UHK5_9MICC|nr:hypothetical protein [Nesterenkonia alkaliphila]MVT25919.1 hypothetical protein [Nesterenkonia alkaliphila]GFZ76278.1 hypothetical protein GCM10011359_00040 [Nesterenkonia alkaliphila]